MQGKWCIEMGVWMSEPWMWNKRNQKQKQNYGGSLFLSWARQPTVAVIVILTDAFYTSYLFSGFVWFSFPGFLRVSFSGLTLEFSFWVSYRGFPSSGLLRGFLPGFNNGIFLPRG